MLRWNEWSRLQNSTQTEMELRHRETRIFLDPQEAKQCTSLIPGNQDTFVVPLLEWRWKVVFGCVAVCVISDYSAHMDKWNAHCCWNAVFAVCM